MENTRAKAYRSSRPVWKHAGRFSVRLTDAGKSGILDGPFMIPQHSGYSNDMAMKVLRELREGLSVGVDGLDVNPLR